ncbi:MULTISPECIES: prenyltransferase [unclassified Marinobacter]|uniref:prenyltransferase n=1 Tax=unclassified Marinobacter TaxID=83889 RepID=UPI0026E45810|nr:MULTISPECIES: prenyltransferase [unclassified Marinobacter]MDO6441634.1 prenyltransferase [Marinobacter sp. 2_MG-2023]MDO6822204.1 prenyltransferase [Marinobacter sp. 1_MG-2023]
MSESIAVVRASRPNFLVLAPLCVGLGVAVAWQQGEPPALLDTLLVFIGALLAHAAVNLFNEYEDFASGLDLITTRTPFSGGSGALPEVPGAAKRVLAAAIGTLALVILIGLYFLWQRGLPMLVLGAAGVVLILTYTRWITRSPILCLFAPGIGFGPVMVLGTLVALGARLDATALTVSVISLILVSELLLINQIPDAEADRKIGRRHLVITLGTRAAARLVSAMFISGYAVLVTGIFAGWLPLASILSLATAPFALWLAWKLPGAIDQPDALNVLLGTNVATLLATLALLIVGLSL